LIGAPPELPPEAPPPEPAPPSAPPDEPLPEEPESGVAPPPLLSVVVVDAIEAVEAEVDGRDTAAPFPPPGTVRFTGAVVEEALSLPPQATAPRATAPPAQSVKTALTEVLIRPLVIRQVPCDGHKSDKRLGPSEPSARIGCTYGDFQPSMEVEIGLAPRAGLHRRGGGLLRCQHRGRSYRPRRS